MNEKACSWNKFFKISFKSVVLWEKNNQMKYNYHLEGFKYKYRWGF